MDVRLDEASSRGSETLPRTLGRYLLLRELGRGATGVAYEAQRDGQTFAVKVLRQGADLPPEAAARFRHEVETCTRVRHDHVVNVHEAGEADGQPYYAMTLLKGRSLADAARAGELPEPREFARRISRVADALHAIHKAGTVHRDVKPGNIMVDGQGRMVLGDFGLARSAGQVTLTKTGEIVGTPLYMSPEQVLGDRAQVDGRADVYGLGATLYELLSGRPLFEANDWPGLVHAIREERPRPLGEVAPSVPAGLCRIVMKALEKRPGDRYADAAALRDDLTAFAEGRSVVGRPVSHARLRIRSLRRHWRPLSIAGFVVLASASLFFTWKATLTVTSYPVAEVLLDGEPVGRTPLETRARPGRHRLLLRSPGFRDDERDLDLRWGSSASVERILVADPDDPAAQAALARRYELVLADLREIRRYRGGGREEQIVPTYPRGDVLAGDLTDFRIDAGRDWDEEGTLEFRHGPTVLHSVAFAPDSESTVAPIPAPVRAALRPGDECEWGFFPRDGPPVLSKFRLVPEPPVTARMDRELADQDSSLAALLRANALLKEGLFLAAYRQGVLLADTGRAEERALAVMQHALEGMKLKETPLWVDLTQRLDRRRSGGR